MPLPLLVPIALAGARILWAASRFGVSAVIKHPVKSLVVGTAATALVNSEEVIEAGTDAIDWTDGVIGDTSEVIDDLEDCIDDPLTCFWHTDIGKVIIIGGSLTAVYFMYKGAK